MFDVLNLDKQKIGSVAHIAALRALDLIDIHTTQMASAAAPVIWTEADLLALPRKVDYTPLIPFVRNQGAWGCGMYSLAACWDICNNLVCPNSPNVSVNRHLWLQIAQLRVDQVVNLIQHLNLQPANVSAAIWYDVFGVSGGYLEFAKFVTSPYGESYTRSLGYQMNVGSPTEGSELTNSDAVQWPTLEGDYELYNYRIRGVMPVKVDVNEFRKALTYAHAPLRVTVWGNHFVAFIGYDDDTQRFKFINSWGDSWDDGRYQAKDGYGYIPYNKLIENVQGADFYEFVTPHSVPTATIHLRSNYRQDVYIWLGVEGKPYTKRIWPDGQRQDDSHNLTITVTLPRGFRWPPVPGNRLYLNVFDSGEHSNGGGAIDFTAAFCEEVYVRHHPQPVPVGTTVVVAPVSFNTRELTTVYLP